MQKSLNYFVLLTLVATAAACGSGKLLEQTTNELNILKQVNAQQAASLAKNETLIVQQEAEIDQLKKENIAYGEEAKDCRIAKQAIQTQFEVINQKLMESGTSLQQLQQKIEKSLEKFEQAGIDVEYKKGLVHLHLPNDLVFTGGGSTVGWEGKQALAVVAEVINEYPNTSIYVLGNTDNGANPSSARDNWAFSTERGNAVTRVLIKNGKVDANRIISGGRAGFQPIADNASANGKWQNRRTDIIINPNIERLLDTASH